MDPALPSLILASSSGQRRAILGRLGVEFEVVEPDVDERDSGPPAELVVDNALRKARAVAARRPPGDAELVLGADTLVAIGERVLGKPAGARDAREFVETLSGRRHEVHGGIALIGPGGGERTGHAVTSVKFHPLTPAAIDAYVATGEWRGRAGGYAIQERGAILVESVDGDYLNVVGLPVAELARVAPELMLNHPS